MESNRHIIKGANDLAATHPALAAQWNYEKNEGLHPKDVSAGSGKRIWWKCMRGHEWRTAVYHRKAGHGCPYCASFDSALHPGINDLQTLQPILAKQWNYEKNKDISPNGITCYSKISVWWKCDNGHSWKAAVGPRTQGRGCPYCANQLVWKGFNDLATTRPELAMEWNYEKNGGLTAQDVTAGADLKVWWKCSLGHEWQAVLYSRKAGSGCPYCAGNTVLPGYNDLWTKEAALLKEWDYERNKDISPDEVAPNTNRKVWWKCLKGHSWQAAISTRTRGDGCPYCSGKRVLAGFNDLKTKRPELALEWDYGKNNALAPENITAFSNRKVWWIDGHGHSWQAQVANRSQGCGCPYCTGKRVLSGFNDLATGNPKLIYEWDFQKNGDLTPEMVTAHSQRYAWWKCSKGHSWKSAISNRNRTGCPYCANRKVLNGFNDLKTIHPELVCEWDYNRNKGLCPEDVTFSTRKKVWWKCDKNHSWKSEIYLRHKGCGCSVCAVNKDHHPVTPGENDLLTATPTLAAEWDYERNGIMKPNQVMPYSTKKVWWKCEKGHHWRTRVQIRQKGTGCPYCSGHITPRSRIVT